MKSEADLGPLPHPRWSFFVIMVKDFQRSTILTKCSILDDAVVLDPHLQTSYKSALQKEQAP